MRKSLERRAADAIAPMKGCRNDDRVRALCRTLCRACGGSPMKFRVIFAGRLG